MYLRKEQVHIKTITKEKQKQRTKKNTKQTNATLLSKLNKTMPFLLSNYYYINALINFSHFWKCAKELIKFFLPSNMELDITVYTGLLVAIKPLSVGKLFKHLLQ